MPRPPRPFSKTRSTCRCGSRPTGSRRTRNACGATATSRGAFAHGERVQRVRAWWRAWRRTIGRRRGARLARLRTLRHGRDGRGRRRRRRRRCARRVQYDGSQPVNVVRLLALLVGVQLVLLAVHAAALAGARRRLAAHAGSAGDAQRRARWAAGRVPPARARVAGRSRALFDWHAARATRRRFAKWQILVLVASRRGRVQRRGARDGDRARDVHGSRVRLEHDARRRSRDREPHRAARSRGRGHALVPSAVPSAELIEQSQFFRLEGGDARGGASRALGALVAVHDLCDRDLRPAAAARAARARGRAAARSDRARCCSRTRA